MTIGEKSWRMVEISQRRVMTLRRSNLGFVVAVDKVSRVWMMEEMV